MDEDKTRTRRYRKGKITYDMSPIPQKLFMRRSHINEEEYNEVEYDKDEKDEDQDEEEDVNEEDKEEIYRR